MSNADSSNTGSDLFGDEASALATCETALQWLRRYRDSHGGVFPEPIFNALIRIRPSCASEVIVHKVVNGEVFFWLTLRAVGGDDPFNDMWHYPGSLDRCGDYLIGGIRRVLESELGGSSLQTCRHVGSIYPVRSQRCDTLSVLFLSTVRGEPASAEQGRWFSAAEAMRLVPLRKSEDGIVPSQLVGLSLCLRALGQPHDCARLIQSSGRAWVTGDNGFRQQILLVDDIDAEFVTAFAP